jgi:uncharacterized protein YndB with AHSA1/START domain
MSFQAKANTIRWRMHFASSPAAVYRALATDEGRALFWAESAPEAQGVITFHILNYDAFSGSVLSRQPGELFELEYVGSRVRFELTPDGASGTDLQLLATDVPEAYRMEMVAGWVSVLMAMKAAVDHGVDLRNHDPSRAWEQGYADN